MAAVEASVDMVGWVEVELAAASVVVVEQHMVAEVVAASVVAELDLLVAVEHFVAQVVVAVAEPMGWLVVDLGFVGFVGFGLVAYFSFFYY